MLQKAHSSTPSSAPASFSGGGPLWTRPLSAASGSVSERSAPAVVPRASYSSYSDRLRPYAMEGLVQDFNTALDETGESRISKEIILQVASLTVVCYFVFHLLW